MLPFDGVHELPLRCCGSLCSQIFIFGVHFTLREHFTVFAGLTAATDAIVREAYAVSLARVLPQGAAVLAVGGKPGEAHQVSAWEYVFAASPHMQAGRFDEAEELMNEGLEANPGSPALLYNLACIEALAGKNDSALDHLLAATSASERFLEAAQTDEDFASIRDDPRFPR